MDYVGVGSECCEFHVGLCFFVVDEGFIKEWKFEGGVVVEGASLEF